MALDPESAPGLRGGTVGEDEQDGQVRRRAHEHLEQVPRQLVDPMAVLEHGDERRLAGARLQAGREEVLERRLAQLRVELAGQVRVGDRQSDDLVEQWHAGDEGGIDRREMPLERRHLLLAGVALLEAKQPAPDLAPHEVRRLGAVGLALAERHDLPAAADVAHELGDEARLAHAGLGGDPDDASPAGGGLLEQPLQRCELGTPPDEPQLEPGLAPRCPLERAAKVPDLDRGCLAFHRHVRKASPDERVASCLAEVAAHVDLSRGGARHEACREVHRVAQAHERATHLVPVGTGAQPALGQPDLDAPGRGAPLEVSQLQRGCRGAGSIILVRERRTEHAVQVGALVAEGQLEDVAAEGVQGALCGADEVVQLADRVVVVVVVDAAEADEDRDRRPQLGQELAAAGAHAFVHRRQEPWPDKVVWEGRGLVARILLHVDQERPQHAARPTVLVTAPVLAN